MLSEKEIREKVIQLERELAIYKIILETPSDNSMGRPKGSIEYSQEEVMFLKECEMKGYDDKKIIEEYNKKFNMSLPYNTRKLYNFMQRQGIRKTGWRWDNAPRFRRPVQNQVQEKNIYGN